MSGPVSAEPNQLVLYYAPPSFYSQKARLALLEKGVSFKDRFLDLGAEENLQPWYIRLHPEGKIPMLQHGDKFIPDSAKIIEYLDKTFGERLLQPDPSTSCGKKVANFVNRLDNMNIVLLTMGSVINEDVTIDMKMPAPVKQHFKNFITKSSSPDGLVRLRDANPDLKDIYQAKIDARSKLDLNRELYLQEVEQAKEVLKEVDKQLAETKTECTNKTSWLFGVDFTAADVILAITLNRLRFVGLSKLLFEGKLTHVEDYFKRLHERPSFKQVCLSI